MFTHVGPDGDALGSITAMGQMLAAQGKQITMVVDSLIPPRFAYLPFIDNVQDKLESTAVFDLIITLDCGDEQKGVSPLETPFCQDLIYMENLFSVTDEALNFFQEIDRSIGVSRIEFVDF